MVARLAAGRQTVLAAYPAIVGEVAIAALAVATVAQPSIGSTGLATAQPFHSLHDDALLLGAHHIALADGGQTAGHGLVGRLRV